MHEFTAMETVSLGAGTEIEYQVFGKYAKQALEAGKNEVRRLEHILSRFDSKSEISNINKHAGAKALKVSDETHEVIANALRFFAVSEGLFDVTIAPLVDLWDYKHGSEAPNEADIKTALALVSSNDLILTPHSRTAMLQKKGQSIDLGGIGKGFISDHFINKLKEYDILSAFINIGGNVSTLGNKLNGSPWRVGIRHPRQPGCLIGAVHITNSSVVTSGDYERYFIDKNGNRFHHILDPRSGYPASSGLISVTIIGESALEADALSTLLFISGLQRGLPILAQFPDIKAVIIDEHLQVYITHNLKEQYQAAAGTKVIEF
jgi:thiamine biosynthesis lipoprotein